MNTAAAAKTKTPRRLAREDERARLVERLYREGELKRGMQLEACGQTLGLTCCHCGNHRTAELHCRKRWCPVCIPMVSRDRVAKYELAARHMRWPLFVTLTVTNSPDVERVRMMRVWWARMRRRKLVVDRIAGGVTSVEVTDGVGGWHPHLHVLCDCEWLAIHTPAPTRRDSAAVVDEKCKHARLELSTVWGHVTGQWPSVVLAKRKKPGENLDYSLKYAVKGSTLIDTEQPIGPLLEVISKSRMVSTFGTMRGLIEEDEEDERPAMVCEVCGEESTYLPDDVISIMTRRR